MARAKAPRGSNAEAVEVAIVALALADEHEATAALARSLAAAVDAAPGDANVAREYRQVLDMLVKAGSGGSDDDTAAFLVSIQTPGVRSSVRNAKKS